jgi:WD40 repeat protein
MWFAADAFHFVWKKVSGDVTVTADVKILGQGGDAHRKAVLMIRQSLDADSAYADAALHGDGLTSLQTRDAKGAATHEIQGSVVGPARLRISKRGAFFFISVAAAGGELRPAGGWMKVAMEGPFYVGIGVCAHNKGAVEKAAFSNVEVVAPGPGTPQLWSTVETVAVASTDRRAVFTTQGRLETPNWSPDGAALVFADQGRLRRVPVSGGQPEPIDTGAVRCERYHGLAPDGKTLAFTAEDGRIYVVPAVGGKTRRVTKKGPSRWHGWSPDGKTLIYSGERRGKVAVLSIPAAGGQETILIPDAENPEYSPDGRYVYFNSNRGGKMQVCRARADGSAPEQVTSDGMSNWFPHVSPDGKSLAFLSDAPDQRRTPQGQDVFSGDCTWRSDLLAQRHAPQDGRLLLRVMSLGDGAIRSMGELTGGNGSLEAPCWSPDSARLGFVSYQVF